jgi:hypothetical protein
MCPHTICVLILASYYYMCPHTTVHQSSCYYIGVLILLYICVLILASYYYMCPHTAVYQSSCYYIGVLILLYMCPQVGASARVLLRAHCCRHNLYPSVYLFYQYKNTDTDTAERCMLQASGADMLH